MSLLESGDSTGEVSLSSLFAGNSLPITRVEDNTLKRIAFLTCRGGWPDAIGRAENVALRTAFNYVDAVTQLDISRVDGVSRNPQTAALLLQSYARLIASQGSFATMRADINSGGLEIAESTFLDYVQALRKLFVIDDLAAWSPNLRSNTAIRTSPTRHFGDPSIAVAALGAGPNELINDLETFGLIFEDLCIRDLRTYMESLDGAVYHYRDKSGLEADAVLRMRNGNYALVEIKLGGDKLIDEGAATLSALEKRIDTTRMPEPAFKMVLTGVGDFSYVREDGVFVVPIRALGN